MLVLQEQESYLAMAMALSALTKENVRKIILCRPAVEAGEKTRDFTRGYDGKGQPLFATFV